MAQVIYTQNALANAERAFVFLPPTILPPPSMQPPLFARRSIFSQHPLIGRRVEGEIRERVISYGKTGYVALYRFLPERGVIHILAIRHQRELDFPA